MGYPMEVYKDAEGLLERKREAAEQALEKRRELLYLRSPRAQAIEYELSKTSVAAARAVVSGANVREELMKLKESNLVLQKELANIIAGFGFQPDYLEEWHDCDKCGDTGFIDGRMCDCMKKLVRELAYDRLNKMSPLALSDFESFDTRYYSKAKMPDSNIIPYNHMQGVLNFCRKYADEFSLHSDSLLFQGLPGLGKTHLSLAIAKTAIDKGFGVIYVSAPMILRKIENEHFDFDNKDKSTERMVSECDLLILDDLGTEFVSRFSTSTVYNILNSRMMSSKPTIISTNMSGKELQEIYNGRILSRIIGSFRRVSFVGTDVRQQKRMKGQGTAE